MLINPSQFVGAESRKPHPAERLSLELGAKPIQGNNPAFQWKSPDVLTYRAAAPHTGLPQMPQTLTAVSWTEAEEWEVMDSLESVPQSMNAA